MPVDLEIVAFDVFGTLVDWHTSITAELAEAGARAGSMPTGRPWPTCGGRAIGRPSKTVMAGDLPFQSLDELHRLMLDENCRLKATAGAGARRKTGRAGPGVAPAEAVADTHARLAKLHERHILTPLSNDGMGLLTRLARAAASRSTASCRPSWPDL